MKEFLKKFILYALIITVLIVVAHIINHKLLEGGVNLTSTLFLFLGTNIEEIKNIILESKTVVLKVEEKENEEE